MTKLLEVYKCAVCGNIVEVLHTGSGTLVCCGQNMDLLEEKVQEEGMEKHLPVITVDGNKVTVNVGEVDHPMEDAHYIEWIEVVAGDVAKRVFLKPGQPPKAEFHLENTENLKVREFCNIHGLWITAV